MSRRIDLARTDINTKGDEFEHPIFKTNIHCRSCINYWAFWLWVVNLLFKKISERGSLYRTAERDRFHTHLGSQPNFVWG